MIYPKIQFKRGRIVSNLPNSWDNADWYYSEPILDALTNNLYLADEAGNKFAVGNYTAGTGITITPVTEISTGGKVVTHGKEISVSGTNISNLSAKWIRNSDSSCVNSYLLEISDGTTILNLPITAGTNIALSLDSVDCGLIIDSTGGAGSSIIPGAIEGEIGEHYCNGTTDGSSPVDVNGSSADYARADHTHLLKKATDVTLGGIIHNSQQFQMSEGSLGLVSKGATPGCTLDIILIDGGSFDPLP